MIRPSCLSLLAVPFLAALFACSRGDAEPSISGDASKAPAAGATEPSPAPATAGADSVVAWAEEIRRGIAPLAGQVGAEPAAARDRAVELYVTRQERIERAVGPGTGSAPHLAESVHEAEARFHELMELLGGTPPPDSTRVAASVEALDAGLAEVLDAIAAEGRESR